jgi:hypothetical protein
MPKKKINTLNNTQQNSVNAARLGFIFLGIYGISIIIYQAWKLMPNDVLRSRWILLLVALTINTTLWFFSRFRKLADLYYLGIVFLQVCMYLAIATFTVYTERGMASNAVILYAIPLAITALTYSGKALFACAVLCSSAYTAAAVTYFNDYPSEGYKVELWGGILFYSLILFLLSMLLWVNIRSRRAR